MTPFFGGFQWSDAIRVLTTPAIATMFVCGLLFGFFGLGRMRGAARPEFLANLFSVPFFVTITLERSFENSLWEGWLGVAVLRFIIYAGGVHIGYRLARRLFGQRLVCRSCGHQVAGVTAEDQAVLERRLERHRISLPSLPQTKRIEEVRLRWHAPHSS